MSTLQVTWYFVVVSLFVGYAILDGFDFGVGFWGFFTSKEEDRRVMRRAIGPVWDGNEVWLVAGATALFGAFPGVYAGLLSGLYPVAMLMVFCLILRAASIEFSGSSAKAAGREAWDAAFAVASVLPVLLLGVALGNLLRGMPFDPAGHLNVKTLNLLNPYALLVGATTVVMVATHGGLFLTVKAGGELQRRAASWAGKTWALYFILVLLMCVWGVLRLPHLLVNYRDNPAFLLAPVATFGALVAIRVFLRRGKHVKAFFWSGVSIASLLYTAALSIFPSFAPGLGDPRRGLNIANTSSSDSTLRILLIVILIGMPLVLIYNVYAYRTFAGKVETDEGGY